MLSLKYFAGYYNKHELDMLSYWISGFLKSHSFIIMRPFLHLYPLMTEKLLIFIMSKTEWY